MSCDRIQLELSAAHDEGRDPPVEILDHVESCDECTAFSASLRDLDHLLAAGSFDFAPDVTGGVVAEVTRPRRPWWAVAAVAVVGVAIGALVGGLGTRLDIGQARDLHDLFHQAGTQLEGLGARLLIVERGAHPDVPERVYSGSISYVAPERLAIELVDTTAYPSDDWLPNDVQFETADGVTVSLASSRCPVPALPDCLVSPILGAITNQPPFDDGVLVPLEIVGPGRSLAWSSAVDVVGTPELDGRPTIQVRSTVAAVELLEAITGRGAWRELHPTDSVIMWLDEETLVPLRLEVFPASSPERELWQIRRGYDDRAGQDQPIFIVEVSDLVTVPVDFVLDVPEGASSGGFVDGDAEVPTPELGEEFELHRTGHWLLSNGDPVSVASWSDGRSWVMVQATRGWNEPRLFGLSQPFVHEVELGGGSIGYLAPSGDAIAIHTESEDLMISGSLPRDLLIDLASSLPVIGVPAPADWIEASNVGLSELPAGTLVPESEGWSILGRIEEDATTILLSGGGMRTVLITQETGTRLDTPIGPDFSAVEVRGVTGRYDIAGSALEWVEAGRVIRMVSDTVSMEELLDLAESMEPR